DGYQPTDVRQPEIHQKDEALLIPHKEHGNITKVGLTENAEDFGISQHTSNAITHQHVKRNDQHSNIQITPQARTTCVRPESPKYIKRLKRVHAFFLPRVHHRVQVFTHYNHPFIHVVAGMETQPL